ncbi:hypothetical protein RRG08_042562 [Elysia crispata]|uniref:Fibrinogen C-terminal domain-containing protein n=1 Tax=Elysia crispata TaxID=231223 RepID=A0AAE0XPU7_9GAST|nr:hypothetical protein RRG08_042562 [Elysia crispata]
MNALIFACFTTAFVLLVIGSSAQSRGLELTLENERIFDAREDICGQLTCRAKGNSVSINSVALTKVNAAGKSGNLLTVSESKPEGEVLLDNIRGNGSLEKNFAFIRMELSESASCESDYFTCKVTFALESGQTGTSFIMTGPGEPVNLQTGTQTDREQVVNVSRSGPTSFKSANPYTSDIWFLGNKITRVEGKFETLSDRLDRKMSENVDAIRKRTGTLENTVLERVASVETDFSARASRLEDRVSSIMLSQSSETRPGVTQALNGLEEKLKYMTSSLATMNETLTTPDKGYRGAEQPQTCERGMGFDITKQYAPYVIMAHDGPKEEILCDTHTDGGGWIVIQRRAKGDVDFYRDWTSYREGFGSLTGDFWIGNEALHKLTDAHPYELRIDTRHKGKELFAEYSSFRITGEADNYRALIGSYTGTFEYDSMAAHNKKPFSTFDRDNDENAASCAIIYHGAWWYASCHHSHLNGVWGGEPAKGTVWYTGKSWLQLYFTEMKIRRIDINKPV